MFTLKQIINRSIHFISYEVPRNLSSKVGFVGLGVMGSNMARNLVKNGRELVIYDINDTAQTEFVKQHSGKAIKVENAKQVAEQSNPVFTMLPNNEIVINVFSNTENGLIAGVKNKDQYLIDCSTVSPSTSRKLHELCSKAGINFHDAPVAGAEPAAIAGTLTFMVGGDASSIKNIEPYLLNMGKKVFNTGFIGTGSAAKICNNMLLAICMLGTSETLLLGERLGVDAKLLTDIINVSSGRNWSSEVYNPVPTIIPTAPSNRNYSGGFLTKYLTKDLGLAQETAHLSQSSIPLGSVVHQIYQIMNRNENFSKKDFSIVYKFLKGEPLH